MSMGGHVSSLLPQFIEISRRVLEDMINSNIYVERPVKVCAGMQRVFPCTAAETIGRTKLPSSVLKLVHGERTHEPS